jgi:hypothetical protein
LTLPRVLFGCNASAGISSCKVSQARDLAAQRPALHRKLGPGGWVSFVVECRQLMKERARLQFRLGERALEIEPLRPRGGAHPAPTETIVSFSQAMAMFAEDIGVTAHTVLRWRWVTSRWPEQRRHDDASYTVHAILAEIPDEEQRFAVIAQPPLIAHRRAPVDTGRGAAGGRQPDRAARDGRRKDRGRARPGP